ncbi:related to 26S proteasome regulatory subunit RPN13 [Saccharomycodes ludwigii]|uniref:Related to 26S proteasome regulatory subunit RPN13 n=1 Tax=Saccharomycodes ludwigii TaxID=36035 RepID=A0A376B3W9_9ASCO|nr:hypothetical protein SCDLUD_004303 [Saccharomycodes ludwigii]KAH3899986.1 hypothetical protein SCDLUD_004303 [Saccharomycodes ludwigii]SSD59367.1 related to 26S proteasome regulatory subunit RPN13 [Saccharomycodes ludwigii]
MSVAVTKSSITTPIPKQQLKFRAGICSFDEETKIITPKPIKGLITMIPVKNEDEEEDQNMDEEEEDLKMYNFKWTPTEKSVTPVEDIEYVLLPGENSWQKIDSCTNGRCFVLLFSSGEKQFFWLQDKTDSNKKLNELSDKDEKLILDINKVMSGEY